MSLYEITQRLQDKNAMQDDLQEASDLIKQMFYKKYLHKIHKEIISHSEKIKNKHSKELGLLHALKPFMSEHERDIIDKIIESITIFKTISFIQQDMKTHEYNIAGFANKQSEHSDGVYDIDEDCIKNNNFLQTMLLMICANI